MGLCVSQLASPGVVLERHLSVKAAAQYSGYNEQYLRRLLLAGRLKGIKIGQVWLIKLASLEAHLRKGQMAQDRRFGPHGVTAETGKGVAPLRASLSSLS